MPTYYKYAERSAESQINWAEVGKNMSDMLKEETRIREEKKSAIDAASREYGQVLANSPQGEHEPARQAALKFADDASKYMLMQDRLLKSGQINLKDYTIARQNLLDGTDNAFTALKDFQAVFAKKMERARTDKSSLYEVRKMEQAEGFGNWMQTEFYINPTNGSVNVAKKTKKVINGQEVYTMDDKPGEFASINYVKGLINGEWNKYDTNAVTNAFAKGLGQEMKEIQTEFATINKRGEIKTIEDITSRTDIDPATKQIMYSFINSENQMIDAALANPFNRGSVLTDNNISASNGKLYDITSDPAKAKANPNLILEVIDPATGMGTLQFTPQQTKDSQDFMRNQVRAKYTYKEELKTTPQVQLQQGKEQSEASIVRAERNKEQLNAAGAWNQLYTGKTPAAKQAAADILLGTPSAKEMGLLKIDMESKPGTVILKYANNKLNREIPMKGRSLNDFSSSGVELHGVTDRKKAFEAGGGGKGYGDVDFTGVTAGRAGAEAAPITIPVDIFKAKSDKSADAIQKLLPNGYIAEDTGGFFGNTVKITAPDGTEISYKSDVSTKDIITQKATIENFLKPKTGTTGGVGSKY